MKYERSRRRHSAALLTITAAGTSSALRLVPRLPVAEGMLSNADTPGADDAFGLIAAASVDAVVIPSGESVAAGKALERSWESAIHSLSASATLIAIGVPFADNCCDFILIDSITKNPRKPPL